MESLNNESTVSSQNDEHDVNIPELESLLYGEAKRKENAEPNISNRVELHFDDKDTINDTQSLSAETSIDEKDGHSVIEDQAQEQEQPTNTINVRRFKCLKFLLL